MSFAGQQFRVNQNSRFFINRIDGCVGDTIHPDAVYSVFGDGVYTANPTAESVSATILDHTLGDKKMVFKKHRRQGYQRKRGYRPSLTQIQIAAISLDGKAASAKKEAAATKKNVVKKSATKTAAAAEVSGADENSKKATAKKTVAKKSNTKPATKK